MHTHNDTGCVRRGVFARFLVRHLLFATSNLNSAQVGARRAGDLPAFWADPAKANKDLGWQVKRGLDEMCADLWKWQSENPNGYEA